VKWLKQFLIILIISFVSEMMKSVIPLPVPASVYGIAILWIALETKRIPQEAVKDVSRDLIKWMPLMFIPSAAGLLDSWNILRPVWPAFLATCVISACLVMIASGRITQAVLRKKGKKGALLEKSVTGL
jgi:holin-like protein